MLPPSANHSFLSDYLGRIFDHRQMDFQYSITEMLQLCYRPSRVYAKTAWRKQTKNHWARDDPAFVVILSLFFTATAMSYGIAFRVPVVELGH